MLQLTVKSLGSSHGGGRPRPLNLEPARLATACASTLSWSEKLIRDISVPVIEVGGLRALGCGRTISLRSCTEKAIR